MKVSKKVERLARVMLLISLVQAGFPEDRLYDRVDKAWPGQLENAENIILGLNNFDDGDLVGTTTQAEIDRWSDMTIPM